MVLLSAQTSVLFVCRGNFCRSPMAEGAFRDELRKLGNFANCDSAGTNVSMPGCAPDQRGQTIARNNGVEISAQCSRPVRMDDFYRFDLILAMDRDNLDNLCVMAPSNMRSRLALLMDMVPGARLRSISDPYHGSLADFAACWRIVRHAAAVLARNITAPCL